MLDDNDRGAAGPHRPSGMSQPTMMGGLSHHPVKTREWIGRLRDWRGGPHGRFGGSGRVRQLVCRSTDMIISVGCTSTIVLKPAARSRIYERRYRNALPLGRNAGGFVTLRWTMRTRGLAWLRSMRLADASLRALHAIDSCARQRQLSAELRKRRNGAACPNSCETRRGVWGGRLRVSTRCRSARARGPGGTGAPVR